MVWSTYEEDGLFTEQPDEIGKFSNKIPYYKIVFICPKEAQRVEKIVAFLHTRIVDGQEGQFQTLQMDIYREINWE